MRVNEYPGILEWPPDSGGFYRPGDEFPMDVSTVVIEKIYPVINAFLTVICRFKNRSHTYVIQTQDEDTAKGLAFWLNQLVGQTLGRVIKLTR
jgi:hypothetical protein